MTEATDLGRQLRRYFPGMHLPLVAVLLVLLLHNTEASSDPSLSSKLSRTKPCPDGMLCPTEASSHPNTDHSDQDKPETKSSGKKKELGAAEKIAGNDGSRSKAKNDGRWQLVDDHGASIHPGVPGTHVSSLSPSEMGPVGRSLIAQWVERQYSSDREVADDEEYYEPRSPRVRCDFLPLDFLECEQPIDLQGNKTAFDVLGYGCHRYGGQKFEDVQNTSVFCTVLPGIECYGERRFLRSGFPCLKFTGHYFLSTLLFSILMGFLGLDRFCLGHTCLATVKLISIGGFGVWWFVDVILLITGHLMPEDGSNWMPYQ